MGGCHGYPLYLHFAHTCLLIACVALNLAPTLHFEYCFEYCLTILLDVALAKCQRATIQYKY